MASNTYAFIERRKNLWIYLIFIIFFFYAIIKNTFLSLPWITEAAGFSATIHGILVFSLAITLFALSYKFSFGFKKKNLLVLLFVTMLTLQVGVWSISPYRCTDAQGNYNLALLVAEKGPGYYLSNYHTLQDTWNLELRSQIIDSFQELGIWKWADTLALNADEDLESGYVGGKYIRSAMQPPLLPLYLSTFIYAFSPSSFDSPQFALSQWFLVAFIPVVMYLLIRKYFGKTTSLKTTFLFMLVPVLLIYTATPVQDAIMPLLFLICTYVFLTAIEKDSNKLLAVSGILVSVTSLVKLSGLVLFLPFLILIIWRFKTRGIPKCIYLLFSGAVMPVLLFLAFNYNMLLNAIVAKNIHSHYATYHLLAQAPLQAMPMIYTYYLTYFGIPLIVLALFGLLSIWISYRGEESSFYNQNTSGNMMNHKNLSLMNRFSISAAITFIISFAVLYGFFIKQLLPAFFLLSLPVAYCLKETENKHIYIYFSILTVQLLLFLFLL